MKLLLLFTGLFLLCYYGDYPKGNENIAYTGASLMLLSILFAMTPKNVAGEGAESSDELDWEATTEQGI